MREILFKAKRIDNGEWVEGYLIRKLGLYFIYDIVNSETCRQKNYEINPKTICQFTGLCDKSGNRIWENDIINHNGECAPVKYGICCSSFDYNFGFYVDFPKRLFSRKELIYCCGNVEVAGNIFDNPELLQEE